jgi:hypothetical protein
MFLQIGGGLRVYFYSSKTLGLVEHELGDNSHPRAYFQHILLRDVSEAIYNGLGCLVTREEMLSEVFFSFQGWFVRLFGSCRASSIASTNKVFGINELSNQYSLTRR